MYHEKQGKKLKYKNKYSWNFIVDIFLRIFVIEFVQSTPNVQECMDYFKSINPIFLFDPFCLYMKWLDGTLKLSIQSSESIQIIAF